MADVPWYVTVAAALATGIVSPYFVERIKASNASREAELKARRDYEYEARKRLYSVVGPKTFQLFEAASVASARIEDLATQTRNQNLGKGGWLSDEFRYYLPSTLYRLLAPVAIWWMLREQITLVDLTLDRVLERQYRLGRAAYDAWASSFEFAALPPPIPYNPDGTPKDESLSETIATTWQGLAPGELERPIQAMIAAEPSTKLITYAKFEDQYRNEKSALRKAIEDFRSLFLDFSPQTHPVLWRVLAAQYFVYRAIRLKDDVGVDAVLARITPPPADLLYGSAGADETEGRAAIRIASQYLASVLRDGELDSATPSATRAHSDERTG